MNDEDKNKKSQSGVKQGESKSDSSKRIEDSQQRSERSETTREEWSKIDKKGHGAGDRPKRD